MAILKVPINEGFAIPHIIPRGKPPLYLKDDIGRANFLVTYIYIQGINREEQFVQLASALVLLTNEEFVYSHPVPRGGSSLHAGDSNLNDDPAEPSFLYIYMHGIAVLALSRDSRGAHI